VIVCLCIFCACAHARAGQGYMHMHTQGTASVPTGVYARTCAREQTQNRRRLDLSSLSTAEARVRRSGYSSRCSLDGCNAIVTSSHDTLPVVLNSSCGCMHRPPTGARKASGMIARQVGRIGEREDAARTGGGGGGGTEKGGGRDPHCYTYALTNTRDRHTVLQ
jgi:hypothetical protein